MDKRVSKSHSALKGEITIPADKSVSHRAIILASIAKGKSTIKNISLAKDPLSTVACCQKLGIDIDFLTENTICVIGGKFNNPISELYCGNSGTTMRLMSGVLASQNFNSVLTGDESLSSRPMKRIIEPLTLMGGEIYSNDNKAPLKIFGHNLNGITYKSQLASAQVKSAVLLAGLFADGKTTYIEPYLSRNHTELMLSYMNAYIETSGCSTSIQKSELSPQNLEIFGDISSAAYFIAGACLIPNSDIIIKNIGLNPTRIGIIKLLQSMGADIDVLDKQTICNEEIGDIRVKYSRLQGCEISGSIIPELIDEIPIIAVMATQAEGQTLIKNAEDLRNKESDRIHTIVNELKKLGADIEETPDGMIIQGNNILKGGASLETYKDHRLAMSLYVAGLICEKEILIKDFEWVNISFPEFVSLFDTAL